MSKLLLTALILPKVWTIQNNGKFFYSDLKIIGNTIYVEI